VRRSESEDEKMRDFIWSLGLSSIVEPQGKFCLENIYHTSCQAENLRKNESWYAKPYRQVDGKFKHGAGDRQLKRNKKKFLRNVKVN
jgi:hypothetical protein